MKQDDINKTFTEYAERYLNDGYTIETLLMAMQRNPYPQVILKKGEDLVWVCMDKMHGYKNCPIGGWCVYIGRKAKDNHEMPGKDAWSLCNYKLEAVEEKYFFCLSPSNSKNKYYTDYDGALHAHVEQICRMWKKGGPLWRKPAFKEFKEKRKGKALKTARKWMEKHGFPEEKYNHIEKVEFVSNGIISGVHEQYRITLADGSIYMARVQDFIRREGE